MVKCIQSDSTIDILVERSDGVRLFISYIRDHHRHFFEILHWNGNAPKVCDYLPLKAYFKESTQEGSNNSFSS